MIWLAIFLLLSAALLAAAWPNLRTPSRHGFYRYFAFEALLGLVLLGGPYWFADPLSPRQVVSWVLLAGSAALAANGFAMLRRHGAPTGGIETTQALVEQGAYRWVRHPLYGSLLLAGIGAVLKHVTPWSLGLVLILAGLLMATARVEEGENLERFGQGYRDYMRRTTRFIPFLY
jgi:protein-S-isoprenylcysteine O-methyltransferase Ste14